jgi:hypothetical protein
MDGRRKVGQIYRSAGGGDVLVVVVVVVVVGAGRRSMAKGQAFFSAKAEQHE